MRNLNPLQAPFDCKFYSRFNRVLTPANKHMDMKGIPVLFILLAILKSLITLIPHIRFRPGFTFYNTHSKIILKNNYIQYGMVSFHLQPSIYSHIYQFRPQFRLYFRFTNFLRILYHTLSISQVLEKGKFSTPIPLLGLRPHPTP